ncbi:predicted protein [Pyrenophora tritici-repentis Pt-1C-BFP]|nr:uncharacterized protein PTRG_04870 [Pyrenophora tritici-repentis Pt-1C-BFP]EDU47777.1 predicted protein [Pyrenophora tritici-repentis Pt-1C-BFP]
MNLVLALAPAALARVACCLAPPAAGIAPDRCRQSDTEPTCCSKNTFESCAGRGTFRWAFVYPNFGCWESNLR